LQEQQSTSNAKPPGAIWNHWIEAVDLKAKRPVVLCKYCLHSLPHPRTQKDSSTSPLNKHYQRRHHRGAKSASQQVSGPMDQFITHPVMAVTKRELEQLLLKAMVECN